MSQESINTLMKFFNGEGTLQFYGKKEVAQGIINIICNGKKYSGEVPDMTILYNGNCLAIEHFEFDCYRKNRKGSQNRKEQARIEKAFEASSENGVLLHDEINGQCSYEQYINNVLAIFNEHYLKISEYKRNLLDTSIVDKDIQIKMAFLIEDVSPLGSVTYDGGKTYPVVLALSKEFLEQLRKSLDIDYIIACSNVGREKLTWLINREDIDEYERHSINYAQMQFIDWTPQVMSFSVELPE